MASMAARLSTRFRCVPSGWQVLCSGISGAIFPQSSSLIRHLLPVIFSPSEIISYDILTIPSGMGSKLTSIQEVLPNMLNQNFNPPQPDLPPLAG